MPDIKDIVKKNSIEINNLKEQRSSLGGTVDKFLLFFDNVKSEDSTQIEFTEVATDVGSITDTLSIGTKQSESDNVISAGVLSGLDFARVDYSRTDYSRTNYYRGGADVEAIITLS